MTKPIDIYTSTGKKFWRHKRAMTNYQTDAGHSIISTHIAPEGACNLKCPYCSVTHRDTHSRIAMETIRDYVRKLRGRGLRAVILTGGGEPVAYPKFNELVRWLRCFDLDVALITNGTLSHRVADDVWPMFSWVRVSVNFFEGWEDRIRVPKEKMDRAATLGMSTVFTTLHESDDEIRRGWEDLYQRVSRLADTLGAKYVRVLPDCLQPQAHLSSSHENLAAVLAKVGDPRFFHQNKNHRAPACDTCHQSYFRPYLSEEPNPWDGKPGTVFPCDSVVLNAPARGSRGYGKFMEKYALCKPGDVLGYLDGEIAPRFVPRADCEGCVFTDTVEMLDHWFSGENGRFAKTPMKHENFV